MGLLDEFFKKKPAPSPRPIKRDPTKALSRKRTGLTLEERVQHMETHDIERKLEKSRDKGAMRAGGVFGAGMGHNPIHYAESGFQFDRGVHQDQRQEVFKNELRNHRNVPVKSPWNVRDVTRKSLKVGEGAVRGFTLSEGTGKLINAGREKLDRLESHHSSSQLGYDPTPHYTYDYSNYN